jgi:hypothetical protein
VSHICPEDIGLTEFIAAILLPTFSAESVSPDGAVAAS